MPQAKRSQTPATETPAPAAALSKGEHNPFLQGLINRGGEVNEAIKGWYAERDDVRTQARMAVKTGFCSEEQAAAVADLFPMPKRKKKGEGDEAAAETGEGETGEGEGGSTEE